MDDQNTIDRLSPELSAAIKSVGPQSAVEARFLEEFARRMLGEASALYRQFADGAPNLQLREEAVRKTMLHLGGHLLQRLFESRGERGYAGSRIPCPCGKSARFVGYRATGVRTLVGPIRMERAYYRCDTCGTGQVPLDKQLGVREAWSPGVQRQAAWLSGQVPFAAVSEMMEKIGGTAISESSVREVSEAIGTEWLERQRGDLAAHMEDPWPRAEQGPTPDTLYVEADGAHMFRDDGWHEVKVGAVFQVTGSGETAQRLGTKYVATQDTVEPFFRLLFWLACTQGALKAKKIVCLGDGAVWIWNRVAEHFPSAVQIVDWYHATEHLWEVGRMCFGEGSVAARRWVEAQKDKLWEGKVEGVLRALAKLTATGAEAREAVRTNIGYFTDNRDRMRYDKFRASGYYIGSGVVESACKEVVGSRMKRPGMRWSRGGAEAILCLRTAVLSGSFEADWQRHRAAA